MRSSDLGGVVEHVNGHFRAVAWARSFCHEIGAHSPAVAIANIGSLPLIVKLIAVVRHRLGIDGGLDTDWRHSDSEEAELWLRPIFPFLYEVLQRSGQRGWHMLCSNACIVLEDLVQVCFPVDPHATLVLPRCRLY